jgi:uncharacterized membrane protein (DUF2068 family)
MKSSSNRLLRLIAAFKFFKGALLIAVGFGAFKLMHKDIGDLAERCTEALRLNPANHFVDTTLQKVSTLDPGQIKKLGAGSLLYAALFLTEGTGLWLGKRWAEWLTVIITSSLVPLEIYEIYRHPSALKVAVLIINLAIVAYLIYRIRSEDRLR